MVEYLSSLSWIDWLGWLATLMFSMSFLVRQRMLLHALGTLACIPKLVYSGYHEVWPLFANWAILLPIEAYQWWKYRTDNGKPSLEEHCNCG